MILQLLLENPRLSTIDILYELLKEYLWLDKYICLSVIRNQQINTCTGHYSYFEAEVFAWIFNWTDQ